MLAAAESCRGGLCKERPGLSYTGHRRFQLVTTDSLEGTAEPLSQDGDVSREKTDLRKSEILHSREKSEERSVRREKIDLVYCQSIFIWIVRNKDKFT